MDTSMEEDDSLLYSPGPSTRPPRLRTRFIGNPNSVQPPPFSFGIAPETHQPSSQSPENSFEFRQYLQHHNSSTDNVPTDIVEDEGLMEQDDEDETGDGVGQEEGGEGEEDGEEDGQGDTTYPESETSSAAFDPEIDPEKWAKRLDEIAGTLEVGEAEARAMRWGPGLGAQHHGPILPDTDFLTLIKHHITTTDWKYIPSAMPSIPLRGGSSLPSIAPNMGPGAHPIRVLGRGWTGYQAGLGIDEAINGIGLNVPGMLGDGQRMRSLNGLRALEDGVRGLGR